MVKCEHVRNESKGHVNIHLFFRVSKRRIIHGPSGPYRVHPLKVEHETIVPGGPVLVP